METCISLIKFVLKDIKNFLQEHICIHVFVNDYEKAWESTQQADPSRLFRREKRNRVAEVEKGALDPTVSFYKRVCLHSRGIQHSMRVKSSIHLPVVYVFTHSKPSSRPTEDCGISGHLCSTGYEGISVKETEGGSSHCPPEANGLVKGPRFRPSKQGQRVAAGARAGGVGCSAAAPGSRPRPLSVSQLPRIGLIFGLSVPGTHSWCSQSTSPFKAWN